MYILKKLFIICYYRNRGCGVGLHSKLFIGFVLLACIVEHGYVHTICFPEFLKPCLFAYTLVTDLMCCKLSFTFKNNGIFLQTRHIYICPVLKLAVYSI